MLAMTTCPCSARNTPAKEEKNHDKLAEKPTRKKERNAKCVIGES